MKCYNDLALWPPSNEGTQYIHIYIKNIADSVALAEFWKSWPYLRMLHCPIFAGNSRSSGISQFRAGKTRSKSTFRRKGVCSPMYNGLFTFYGPSQYLSSFSSWRLKRKKFPFFTKFYFNSISKKISLLRPQFWCHRPSQQLVWTVTPQSFQR